MPFRREPLCPDPPPPHEVRAVLWDQWRGVRVRTDTGTCTVLPAAMIWQVEKAPRLLEPLRQFYGASPQENWPAFCRRVALPAMRSAAPTRPLRPFERFGWATDPVRDGLPMVLAVEFGAVVCQTLGGVWWVVLLGPALWLEILAVHRLRRCRFAPTVHARPPGEVRKALAVFAPAVAAVAACAAVVPRLPPGGWVAPAVMGGLFLPAAVWLVVRFAGLTRDFRAFAADREREALEEWEALHADPQRDPAWLTELWAGHERQRPGR